MRFNLDYKSYRKNLADTLKETRKTNKDGAVSILETEKKEDKYKISKLKEVKNVKKETLIEDKLKEIEQLGYEVIDISQEIPEHIKLIIDKARIKAFQKNTSEHTESCDGLDNNILKEIHLLIDKFSDGKYLDRKNPNHVINAWNRKNFILGSEESYLDIGGITNEQDFYFSFGHSWYLDPTKPIIIMSLDNPRFKNLMWRYLHNSFEDQKWEECEKILEKKESNFISMKDIDKIAIPTIELMKKKEELIDLEALIEEKKERGTLIYDKTMEEIETMKKVSELNTKEIKIDNEDIFDISQDSEWLTPYLILEQYSIFLMFPDLGLKFGKRLFYYNKYVDYDIKWADFIDIMVDLEQEKVYKFKKDKFKIDPKQEKYYDIMDNDLNRLID